MGVAGKGTVEVGVRYPYVGNVLSGSGASGSVLWLVIMGHVRGDGNYGRGDPYLLRYPIPEFL